MSSVRYTGLGLPRAVAAFDAVLDAHDRRRQKAERRVRRILASIQRDVDEGGTARVRQILRNPQELYRIEVERPDMSYLRTTVLGRDALQRETMFRLRRRLGGDQERAEREIAHARDREVHGGLSRLPHLAQGHQLFRPRFNKRWCPLHY